MGCGSKRWFGFDPYEEAAMYPDEVKDAHGPIRLRAGIWDVTG